MAGAALSSPPRTAEELVAQLRGRGPALVALSGGVDSAVVASLAARALGDRLLTATVVGAAVSSAEVTAAESVARAIGARHRLVAAEPLADERYRENGADRCYRCRSVETRALVEVARIDGATQLLDGIHADDLTDDRPGLRAMDEAGFLHPLLWAGWRKADVRRYAGAAGLPNFDRPSNACLASRVRRGEPISRELLERVERAEAIVAGAGFRRVRVRVDGRSARVEVGAGEVHRLASGELWASLSDRLRVLGFGEVTFDPHGYAGGEELPIVR